jgi:hypothetical protein
MLCLLLIERRKKKKKKGEREMACWLSCARIFQAVRCN